MAENIQDGIIIIENGNVVFANHRIAIITGYSNGELIKMKSSDLVSPEDRDRIEKTVINIRPILKKRKG